MSDSTKYSAAVGRRKTATASVRITKADTASVTVNGKSAKDYFKTMERTKVAEEALSAKDLAGTYAVSARVSGGGVAAQAEAVRHAISRAILKEEAGMRGTLKTAGYLRRDPRAVERKKPGLRKARKSPQWSKR
ncbi:MAG: 30S ribosomal protein S9 [bacterium]